MATLQSQLIASSVEDLAAAAPPGRHAKARLIVVASDIEQDALLAARILPMARARGLDVLLFGLSAGALQEDQLRRKLALLAAFIRDGGTRVEIRVEHGGGWLGKLKAIIGSGDVLACPGAMTPPNTSQPLVEVLSSRLRLPVNVFDVSEPAEPRGRAFLPGLLPWLLSIAVILGFLWLQIRITQSGDNGFSTILLIALVPLEIALIWLCNSLFS